MRRFETGVFGEFNLAFFHQSSYGGLELAYSAISTWRFFRRSSDGGLNLAYSAS